MTGAVCQRWRERRDSYRPAGEVIRPAEYDVAEIGDDTTARAFVLAHHYSGSYPAARSRWGLYRRGELVGVAVFSHPVSQAVLVNVFGTTAAVELGRFVLLDEVPANGESYFLARAFDRIRGAVAGVVSFSDPLPRARADGSLVTPGHVGTIYQATNGAYLGRGTARTLALLPDGRVFSERAVSKIRRRERGWRYAVAQLEGHGAPAYLEGGDWGDWLRAALRAVTRPVRHPGCHRYAWRFDGRALLRSVEAYPKRASWGPLFAGAGGMTS